MIEDIKKIELHVHLDGSLRVSTLSELKGISEEDAKKLLIAPDKCRDLNEYLCMFDEPVKIMQTKENISRVSKELVEDLIKDNCVYAEVRFAPNKHTNNLTIDEVVNLVTQSVKNDNIKVNIILCMMRGDSLEDNKRVVDVAYKYLNKGVCAIDLAGAEKLYKNDLYKELFDYAKSLGIPYTIHAGEADTYESVKSAIEFGAKRIGHGINSINDKETLALIKNKNILLEVCPTSNIQTNAIESISDHPIRKFYDLGIHVSINTDNRTVSNVSLNDEYKKLKDAFNFTIEDFKKMNMYALESSFISEEEKELLREVL